MRRRDLLLGGVGLGGVTALTGLPANAGAPARRLVMLLCDGGWDTTFSFDPKPGVAGVAGPYVDLSRDDPLDREEVGTWGEIAVTLNDRRRPGLTRFFEAWGHRATVVRGLWVGSVSHWIGRDRILTGTDLRGAPDLTAITGHAAADRPVGMVDLSGLGRFGAYSARGARAGERGQLRGLLLPEARFPQADGSSRPAPLGATDRAAIDAWLVGRHAREARRDPRRDAALAQRMEARRRADDLRALGPDLEPVLPAGARDLADQVDLTLELLAGGVCQAVLVDSAQPWDTHARHATQHVSTSGVFFGLERLADGLDAAGLLDETLVVALSEMGRSPGRNDEDGTEHWPYTGALLLGAGVAGGRVCGATDDGLVGLPVDLGTGRVDAAGELLRYDHLAAGILAHLGIDPVPWLPGVDPLRGFVA